MKKRDVKKHPILVLAAGALLATACTTSSPDGVNDSVIGSVNDTVIDDDLTEGVVEVVELSDTGCFGDDTRCGTALIPQVPGSRDLVEMGFRVLTDSGDGVPVVLLEEGLNPIELDPADFPGRPLIAVGSRGRFPGGPGISCPEWERVPRDSRADTITAATVSCVQRLTDAGIDLAGGSRENLAGDVIAVLDALDITEFDLIAPGLRADLVALIAASPLALRKVVYVQPRFSGEDLVATGSAETVAALDAIWARCAQVEDCSAPGTVDDFLAGIETLEDRPISYVGAEDSEIDADRVAAAMLHGLDTARGAAFLPELHRLIVERDAAALSSYVDSSFSTTRVDTFTVVCGRVDTAADDSADLPPLLRRRSMEARVFFAAACPTWGVTRIDEPLTPPEGLLVTSLSAVHSDGTSNRVGPTIREPTVGAPSPACVLTAAAAWFDGGRVDDTACRTPLAGGRDLPWELIEGRYVYDERITVLLQIPSTWTDYSGVGTWYRDVDPLDSTNLDVYVWNNDDRELTRAEMVDSWGLADPSYETRSAGGREWLIAIGEDGSGDGTFSLAIAVSRIEGVMLGFVLGADGSELDELIDTVLVPSLAAAAIEP